MDKNLLIRFFEGQATTDEEMKVRKWMEASTENRRTYFNCSSCSDYSGHHTILQEPRATRILAHCSKDQCSSWSTYQFGIV